MERVQGVIARLPEMGEIGPLWCHVWGSKMELDKESSNSMRVTIGNGQTALLSVSTNGAGENVFFVEWELRYGPGDRVHGVRKFSREELEAAFGLHDGCFGVEAQAMIDRFGGEAVAWGHFIRWQNFLNIPCAGTGNDGDPNISIHLDDEIKGAIEGLIHG